MNPQNAHPGLSPALTVLIAIATGLAVASNYYAQPLGAHLLRLDDESAGLFLQQFGEHPSVR